MPVRLADQECASLVQQIAREMGIRGEAAAKVRPFLHDVSEIVVAKLVTRLYGDMREARQRLAEVRRRVATRGTAEEMQLVGRVQCLQGIVLYLTEEPEELAHVDPEPRPAAEPDAQEPGVRPDPGCAPTG